LAVLGVKRRHVAAREAAHAVLVEAPAGQRRPALLHGGAQQTHWHAAADVVRGEQYLEVLPQELVWIVPYYGPYDLAPRSNLPIKRQRKGDRYPPVPHLPSP